MQDFVDTKEWTMPKTKRFPPWRPDKVVTQTYPEDGAQHWSCIKAEIIGRVPTSYYAEKGEDILAIEFDNTVRTPSDHMGIVADFMLKNQEVKKK